MDVSLSVIRKQPNPCFTMDTFTVYFSCFLYFFCQSAFFVSYILLVAEVSKGSFESMIKRLLFLVVGCVSHMLSARYTSALSDYVGRRPMMIAANMFIAVSAITGISLSISSVGIILRSVFWGFFEIGYPISKAWLADLVNEQVYFPIAYITLLGASVCFGLSLGMMFAAVFQALVVCYLNSHFL